MLEPHPPHHTPNTWRDFFIHIATIVVGLLIAIGLEQAVEAIHHHHQREHLEQALAGDMRKEVDDALRLEKAMNAEITAITTTIAQVHAAAVSHRPLASVSPIAFPDGDTLSNSASSAARSSGLLSVLKEEDVRANAENDTAVDFTNNNGVIPWFLAYDQMQQFELVFRGNSGPDSPLDLSSATAPELERYSSLLGSILAASVATRTGAQYARGSASAILHGDRDLSRIQKMELHFVTPIGTPPVP